MFPIFSSAIKYLCAKYSIFVLHRGEKTWRTPLIRGDQSPPPLWKKGKSPQHKKSRRKKMWWSQTLTTTGDRDVVDPNLFTSESAQILIGEIMGCNLALENLKKKHQ
ncbi:hypothetical protein AB205_0156400 [Aquarana catesbeiana]|uniref:Uncharacterized protein n=1 Tax=Aquarana catesbeiana TaxID=8400 RepID=A0A2G9Q326_AQUCT|nr:hypothetical protein AB205_0156400 [Aquarana catesbeiana]